MPQPSLILFRSPTAEDPFVAEFETAGWKVTNVPVLGFSFVNRTVLHNKLTAAEGFEGIVITSPRAAVALARVCAEDPMALSFCAKLDIVCTGKRTATPLVEVGLTPLLSPVADATGVARFMIASQPTKRWLFLSGNLRRPELPALLTAAGVSFAELEVYQTVPQPDIDLEKLKMPAWVGFFSPSGVEAVRQVWPNRWENVKKAAIGATTADAIRGAKWCVDAVADTPEAAALRVAMENSMPSLADGHK